jgi:hypothetical protein
VGEQCSNGESLLLFEALYLNRASPVASGFSGIQKTCWGGEWKPRRGVDAVAVAVAGSAFRLLLFFVIVRFVEWIFAFCVALFEAVVLPEFPLFVALLLVCSTIESCAGGDGSSVVQLFSRRRTTLERGEEASVLISDVKKS